MAIGRAPQARGSGAQLHAMGVCGGDSGTTSALGFDGLAQQEDKVVPMHIGSYLLHRSVLNNLGPLTRVPVGMVFTLVTTPMVGETVVVGMEGKVDLCVTWEEDTTWYRGQALRYVGDGWARRVLRRIWVHQKGITTDSRLDLGETQSRMGEVDLDAARKDQMTSEVEWASERVLW